MFICALTFLLLLPVALLPLLFDGSISASELTEMGIRLDTSVEYPQAGEPI